MQRRPRVVASVALGAAALGATLGGTGGAQEVARPVAERWTLAFVRADTFALELRRGDGTTWTRAVPFAELRGAAPRDVAASEPTPVTFRVERDAGSFEFDGTFYAGRGAGTFRYRADRRFADTLRALGVAAPGEATVRQLERLALADVSADAVREFRALGVAPLRLDDLLALATRQVTPAFVRWARRRGLRDATPAALIALRQREHSRDEDDSPGGLTDDTRGSSHAASGSSVRPFPAAP